MECSCIKGHFDVHTLELSADKIMVTDISDWMEDPGYYLPISYEVEVIPPGSASGSTVSLTPKTNVVLDSSSVPIKDGVYVFKVTNCGTTFTDYALVLPKLRCCLDKAWATLPQKFHKDLEEVERWLQVASVAVSFNEINEAYARFDMAKKLFNNLKCDCDC